ncbi:MAG: outer membrane beta-barrel protein [Sphingomonadales bacterium]|nr:outer membrane beta-barrel protein [Sphingomonadales bacterium]
MKKVFLLAAASVAVVSAPAHAQDSDSNAKDGFRVELRSSYETPTVSSVDEDGDIFKLGSALSYGGEVGYDFAVSNNVTVGPFVTYEESSVGGDDGDFALNANGFLFTGLQVGVSTSVKGQVYGKVGYAQFTENLSGTGIIDIGTGPQNVTLDANETGKGVGFAIGYEHGFGQNFYGRLEGGYADVGKIFNINTQRRYLGVALGVRF